ncbi:MAG: phosphoenolpyruvate--protein phosphotransferase [Thermodesulfobacteriota bacterium]
MQSQQIHILEDIFQTITESDSPEKTLDQLVQMLADKLNIDVCSVYVYNRQENKLVLKATVGLAADSVDSIEMDLNEGLTGLVIEEMKPVFVVNPSTHPRFKYYAKSGEEAYSTFLGLPLIYHQKVLGVLVIQTVSEDSIKEPDIPVFANIASQISATVAYTGLLEDAAAKNAAAASDLSELAIQKTEVTSAQSQHGHLRGDPVSEQVAEGYAYYLPENIDFDQVHCTWVQEGENETRRLEKAFQKAGDQIRHLARQSKGITDQESAIVDAHLMFLEDPALQRKIFSLIEKGYCAEYALKQVIMEYVEMFHAMEDAYLSERGADVLDIGRRVLGHLMGVSDEADQAFKRPTILIASDISPVDLLAIRQPNLKGIVTARGGRTSHTVILSKSLEIPIVIGVEELLDRVRQNDYLIIDGASGFVFVNPPGDIRDEYARLREENQKTLAQLESIRDLPAVTLDGFSVRMGANIGLLSDMALVNKYGCDHIGLYRTEFPFLLRKSFPSEDEQVRLYTRMIERAEGKSVTIRTFDVGGDKFLSYLDYPREQNPFLGWRSIRVSLDLEDQFRTQIRSILRASAAGDVNFLFPMISSVEEIRRVVELVELEKNELDKMGIAYDADIQLGIMVEVPGAVMILDRLLKYVDFVSIGTNDLIQYLLAVDRNNKKVAGRYNAMHPSVITTVSEIVRICKQHNKSVSICGEAAARPENLFLYIGMGADRISMAPSSVPAAKQMVRSIGRADAQKALEAVNKMDDAATISAFMADYREKWQPPAVTEGELRA